MTTPIQDGPVQGSGAVVRQESRERQLPALQTDANGNIPPSQLIMQGIERGLSAETMRELVALQHQLEDRNAAKEFARALARFKAKCPTIYKDKKITVTRRDGGSYSFMTAPLDRIAEVINGPLEEEGFSYYWDRKMEGNLMHSICHLVHVDGHERVSTFPIPTASANPGMSDQQKFAGAATFADRKSLAAVIGLVAADEGEEDDARQVDPTPVSEDQATYLDDRITETGANRKKFLAHFEVESVDKLPAARYDEAVTALNQFAARKKDKEAAK